MGCGMASQQAWPMFATVPIARMVVCHCGSSALSVAVVPG
jgi:hypothetical protein